MIERFSGRFIFLVVFLSIFAIANPVLSEKKEKNSGEKKAESAKGESSTEGEKKSDSAEGGGNTEGQKEGGKTGEKGEKSKDKASESPQKGAGEGGTLSAPREGGEEMTSRQKFMLLSIEEKVNSLKERIFRSKAQLALLKEALLHGTISASRLIIVHNNQMSSMFMLESAAYTLDNNAIFSRSDHQGSLNKKSKFVVFKGTVQPGPHRLYVTFKYRGRGFGIFSYLRKYRFKLRSAYSFTIREGTVVTLEVIPYMKSWTLPLEKRPAIRYRVKTQRLVVKRKSLSKIIKK